MKKPKNKWAQPKIIVPLSPFKKRMMDFAWMHQVPPEGTAAAFRLQEMMEMDVGFQAKCKAFAERFPYFVHSRMKNGSGLPISKLLRSYFLEYLNRFRNFGPDAFPTSFNVVESFMHFNREWTCFDLFEEKEHLLSINSYFEWYGKSNLPDKPAMLQEIMKEKVIYSYDLIIDAKSLRISNKSTQIFAGVAFVRHGSELSCLLLAGENLPPIAEKEFEKEVAGREIANSSRKKIVPDPSLTAKDRYLDGHPEFCKVILLTRFDLEAGKHDVRYVNVDMGPSFAVFTDDSSVFRGLPRDEIAVLQKNSLEELENYNDLFAALSSMIYLPAFFAADVGRVQDLTVSTEMHALSEDKKSQETLKKLGEAFYPKHRTIKVLPLQLDVGDAVPKKIEPPDFKFQSDGYWKAIGPQEIGKGKNDEQIFGRTWVERHESWSARSPQSLLLEPPSIPPSGPDPGTVYIQRSPALEHNLYKVGLTRRNADIRSSELSSATGVPLPFEVLASWVVGDCAKVEREVHLKLQAFRINPKREFFNAELTFIIGAINTVIHDLKKS